MEKLPIIFSALIHSDDFMYIFWGLLGILNMSFGTFFLRSKGLTEKELIEISPSFKNINSDYNIFSVFALILIVVPTWMMMVDSNNWSLLHYGRKFYPSVAFFCSGYGIYQALFAFTKGVYPMGKMLYFKYGDERTIRHAAKINIISSVVLFALSIIVFFATV